MKKVLIYAVLPVLLGITSCSKESTYKATSEVNVGAINLVTNSETGETTASSGVYNLSVTQENGRLSAEITSSTLVVNNSAVTISIPETEASEANGFSTTFSNLTGTVNGNSNIKLTNGNFLLTSLFNTPLSLELESSTEMPYRILVAQYNIGEEYKVKTFLPNTFFTGETVTTYPNGEGGTTSFTPGQGEDDKPMVYELSLDIVKKQAKVIIYNAKFAPPSPSLKEVHLSGLNMDFTGGIVKIYGENIIPEVPEGEDGGMTPYENFPFNSFELVTTNEELTDVSIKYTVATVFNGSFTGSYLIDLSSL